MAEVAAGLIAAEQGVATAVEAAAVTAIAMPSLPLKLSLTRLPFPSTDPSQQVPPEHSGPPHNLP